MQKLANAIPTCISCSQGGYIIAIGYTDERVRLIDMRVKGNRPCEFEMQSQHSDIIKCLSLSPDGMVCLSAGSDCSLKVWDVSSRRCIKTNQGETGVQRRFSSYHRETISSMDVDYDSMVAFTGGRDGSIFQNHIDDTLYSKIYQGDPKQMITCLKFDEVNKRLWYGTPDSQF